VENVFGWAVASFEIGVNTYLRKMTKNQNIILLQLLSNHSRQYTLVKRQKVIFRIRFFTFHLILLFKLFKNFQKCANIVILGLIKRGIDKTKGIHSLV